MHYLIFRKKKCILNGRNIFSRIYIDDEYVQHAGYNEVGELNNIIILYPQVILIATNPGGCWDWFGYTGYYYGMFIDIYRWFTP